MDKLTRYRMVVKEMLSEYAAIPISNGEIESFTAFDLEQDHYQVINIGWDGYRRVYGCVLHLDIIDGKVWIQHNMTERRIGHDLMDKGVAREDIVLGFQAPEMRPYTEFATA